MAATLNYRWLTGYLEKGEATGNHSTWLGKPGARQQHVHGRVFTPLWRLPGGCACVNKSIDVREPAMTVPI